MAEDRQRLPLGRNLGDAFGTIMGAAFGRTPKAVAVETQTDPRAARNALEGKAGVPFITKALLNRQKANDDHYDLYLAIGQLIFGETLDQYEERKLQRIIERAEHETSVVDTRLARRRALREVAYSDPGGLDQRRA